MISCILLSSLAYEGPWILGVVESLDQALDYFLENIENKKEEYWTYTVEKWDGTQRVCSYEFNTETRLLEEHCGSDRRYYNKNFMLL
jgi:hypothetical protein